MPLREPGLISHGLYVWHLMPALRAIFYYLDLSTGTVRFIIYKVKIY